MHVSDVIAIPITIHIIKKPDPDVPDNFKKYKTKTIPKNIILSKSKYD